MTRWRSVVGRLVLCRGSWYLCFDWRGQELKAARGCLQRSCQQCAVLYPCRACRADWERVLQPVVQRGQALPVGQSL